MSVGDEKGLAAEKEKTTMAEAGKATLQKNPVISYRDPYTGRWRVDKDVSEEEEEGKSDRFFQKKLRQNPLTSYRDPATGRWVAVKSPAS